MVVTLEFRAEKETKNTVKYQEVVAQDEKPRVGTLYVQKQTLAEMGIGTNGTLIVELKSSR